MESIYNRLNTTKLVLKISFVLGVFILIGLESCFKEVDTVKLDPLETITAINNVQFTQTYYKIEENEIRMVKFNNPGAWDLGFETGTEGWHIVLNYSASARIINTGISDFSEVDINTANDLLPINDEFWLFNHPNGDLDSTATGNWIDSATVYILFRGASFEPEESWFKIKFESVDANEYLISYSDLNTDIVYSKSIPKNDATSFVYYSFEENEIVALDPGKNEWDLLFTPYLGYYLMNTGEGVPYYLAGVYMNYLNGIEVKEINDADIAYEDIDATYIEQYESSTMQDAIGYDWKLIPSPPDYRYYVDENIKYIIRAVDGNYYKFRFVSFYNEMDDKGYPIFQYKQIL